MAKEFNSSCQRINKDNRTKDLNTNAPSNSMNDEQTKKTDTSGTQDNKAVPNTSEPVSEYDKALELVKRREEASKVELEILAKKEKMAANDLLSGNTGGHIPPTKPTEETDKEYADRMVKGNFKNE